MYTVARGTPVGGVLKCLLYMSSHYNAMAVLGGRWSAWLMVLLATHKIKSPSPRQHHPLVQRPNRPSQPLRKHSKDPGAQLQKLVKPCVTAVRRARGLSNLARIACNA